MSRQRAAWGRSLPRQQQQRLAPVSDVLLCLPACLLPCLMRLPACPSSCLAAIEFAEPDYRVSVNWAPNDSLFKVQWHHRLVGSEAAWNSSRGSKAVKVRGGLLWLAAGCLLCC